MEKKVLLENIQTLDFMALDLHLYLNTHPRDFEALQMYNRVVASCDKCRSYYETTFGPLCSYRSAGLPNWTWSSEAWPWEAPERGDEDVDL
ncbi:MAG: spore coat protein CotJB [Clostridiales bacterium]|jgi:spore coat protein JB|nr:spore coat protein CotJB [Clostridiales bacterium]